MALRVEEVKIITGEYDFSVKEFTSEQLAHIKKLLQPPDQTIEFIIRGGNSAIANALRRTAISGVAVKALDYDPLSIDTNEEYIILEQLHDRIRFIPLQQDCPDDVTFQVDVVNVSKVEQMSVLSSDIKPANLISLTNYNKMPFHPNFCIARLHQTKFLRIPLLRVTKGFGWQHASYSLTKNIEWSMLDYRDVAFVNSGGNIQNKMVRVSELTSLLPKTADPLHDSVLIIPNPAFELIQKIPEGKYQHLIEQDLPSYSSTEMKSREFAMKFTFHDNIDPKAAMVLICDSVINRLRGVAEEMAKSESTSVRVTKKGNFLQLYILGETHTIDNLLVQKILDLDPGISLINLKIEHVLNRSVMLNVNHPNALKISRDACLACADDFLSIRKSFE